MEHPIANSVAVALLILLLRTVDVSLGTVRTVFAVQGRKVPAAAIGFVEALCFVLAVGIVFSDLQNPVKVVGYAAGFGVGTALGVTIVEALKLGTVTVRFVSPEGRIGIADALGEAGFGLTVFDGNGQHGPIRMIVAVVRKRDLDQVLAITKPWLDRCFVTITEETAHRPPYYPQAKTMADHPVTTRPALLSSSSEQT